MKKQFDRFVLTELISKSPHFEVYGGDERLPGGVTRPSVVKVLPAVSKSDPAGERRFVDEVRVLAALAAQPHVVTFYGVGVADGVPWVATERPPSTLAALLGPAPADPAGVARVIEHVARGLAALHAMQPPLLHNRLQPSNVLAWPGVHYKVAEFGLSAPAAAEPTLELDLIRYAAPELLSSEFGKAGPAADLYALGHIAYEMALGSKLHARQFPAVVEGVSAARDASPSKWQAWHHSISTTATPVHEAVPTFPRPLSDVIAKLMAKPLASRYATAEEVIAAVAQATTGVAVPAEPAAADAPPARQAGRLASPPPPLPARPTAASPTASAPPKPPATPGVTERYYVKLRNTVSGPFDAAALQRLARQGQLSRLHQVSLDQRTWKSASTVEGLFG